MLLLVDADRNNVCLVQQNIGCHQYRVGKEPRIDVVRMLLGFVLELRHAGKFAEHGVAVENPGEFRVRGDVGLYKQCVFVRIQSARHIQCKRFIGAPP